MVIEDKKVWMEAVCKKAGAGTERQGQSGMKDTLQIFVGGVFVGGGLAYILGSFFGSALSGGQVVGRGTRPVAPRKTNGSP